MASFDVVYMARLRAALMYESSYSLSTISFRHLVLQAEVLLFLATLPLRLPPHEISYLCGRLGGFYFIVCDLS